MTTLKGSDIKDLLLKSLGVSKSAVRCSTSAYKINVRLLDLSIDDRRVRKALSYLDTFSTPEGCDYGSGTFVFIEYGPNLEPSAELKILILEAALKRKFDPLIGRNYYRYELFSTIRRDISFNDDGKFSHSAMHSAMEWMFEHIESFRTHLGGV